MAAYRCAMPCYRCGAVQTDPQKGGPSPWARGVVEDEQILICPNCQAEHPEWTGDLKTCASCDSTRLSMVMGSVICRECGHEQTVREH